MDNEKFLDIVNINLFIRYKIFLSFGVSSYVWSREEDSHIEQLETHLAKK